MRWPAFLSLVLLLSCTGPEKQVEILLPGSTGGSLEVLVVMEHALWEGSVGSKVREQFNAPMPACLKRRLGTSSYASNPKRSTSCSKSPPNLHGGDRQQHAEQPGRESLVQTSNDHLLQSPF